MGSSVYKSIMRGLNEALEDAQSAKPILKRPLHNVLGTVDTEEFISFLKSDQFDYTKWQRHHFDDKTPEQISTEATIYVTEHPYTGDPSTII